MNRTELIRRIEALNLDKREYWVVAGAAMVLHGLRDETRDIDLGCSKKLADELENRGCTTAVLPDGLRRIEFADDVEIFEEWLYDRVVTVDDIPAISLNGLLEMKKSLGREKDLADVMAIEEHIRRGGGGMTYRVMTEGDIERVVPLYIEYYNAHEGGEWTVETTGRRIRQVVTRMDSYCLLCEDGGEVVAFAMGYFEQYDDCFAYDLVEIVVTAGRQNEGIGSAFMRELEKRVKDAGAMLIQLESVADERHERFYGRLGYGTVTNFVLKTKML